MWFRYAVTALFFAGLLISAGPPAYVLTTFNSELGTYKTKSGAQTGIATSGADAQSFALSPDGQTAYAASMRTDAIHVIDLNTNTITATLATGKMPVSVALSPDNSKLYVLSGGSRTLGVIDTASGVQIANVVISDSNFSSVAVKADGTAVYVAAGLGVTVVDPATNTVVGSVAVPNAKEMAFSPSGDRLYVTSQSGHPSVFVISTNGNSILKSISMGNIVGLSGIAVSPDGGTVYAVNAVGLTAISTSTYAITGTAAAYRPTTMSVTPDGQAGFSITNATQLVKWNLVKLSAAQTTNLNGSASAFSLSSNASSYYVLYSSYNLLSVVDTDTSQVISRINGTPGTESFVSLAASSSGNAIVTNGYQSSTNSNVVSVIDRDTGRITQSVTLSPRSHSSSVAVNSTATLAFVPVGDAQPAVGIVDLTAGELRQTVTIPGWSETANSFLQISPDDQTLFVVVVAPPGNGASDIQLCRVNVALGTLETCVSVAPNQNVDVEYLPHLFVLNQDGSKVYIPIDKAVMGEFDSSSLQLLRTVSLPISGEPLFAGICISASDNSLFVAFENMLNSQTFVFGIPLDTFASPSQSPAENILPDLAVTPDGTKLYLAESSVALLDAHTFEPLSSVLPQQLADTVLIPVN